MSSSLLRNEVRLNENEIRVKQHAFRLLNFYKKYPIIEVIQECSFPFLFFLALLSFSFEIFSSVKYLLVVLCVIAYFVSNKIPMSLSTPAATTAVSMKPAPYFAAFTFAVEACVQFLLIVTAFTLVSNSVKPETEVFFTRSELNRGLMESFLILVPTIYVFTIIACE